MTTDSFAPLLPALLQADYKALARCISLVESEYTGWFHFLQQLPSNQIPVVGITGPPGAGKSTLVDALIGHWVSAGKKVGVICVDPSSPFNLGALLGDRIRMSQWYNHPNVFIRSLATRGAMGGLHPKIIEITDVMKAAGFDYILVETVGVGQSEIEIAGLADCTVVVLVPEAGDDIQTMKAGLMEIADVFVVNKADRPGADVFVKNLQQMLAPAFQHKKTTVSILKTAALSGVGIAELSQSIADALHQNKQTDKRLWLLTEKAWHLIEQNKMRHISKAALFAALQQNPQQNLYQFVQQYA